MPILWTFPSFIGNLVRSRVSACGVRSDIAHGGGQKKNGVDTQTIVRLTTFHELNTLRVVFRFLFVAPLLILAIDGVRPHQHVNESP